MVVKPEQQQMQQLLTEAITALCKNGLHYRSHFNVEGLLGITLDDEDVFLVSIKQTVKGDEGDPSLELKFTKGDKEKGPMSRAKQRKRRKRSNDSIERVAQNSIPVHDNNNTEKLKSNNVPYSQSVNNNSAVGGGSQVWHAPPENKNGDFFDDNVSSPGEVIVVKEENLTDAEHEAAVAADYSLKQNKPSKHSTDPETYRSPTENGSSDQTIYAGNDGQILANSNTDKTSDNNSSNTPAYARWNAIPAYRDGTMNREMQNHTETSFSQQDCEPDDTACLKAAYASTPSEVEGAANSSLGLVGANPQRSRKRTLDSVVKILHNSKKQIKTENVENCETNSENVDFVVADGYITAKNINNNDVTIDSSTGLEVKPMRKKGPFGKKRLTEIVDANANNQLALTPEGVQDLSINSSINCTVSNSPHDATCHICNKVLSTKASYKRHMNFHQGIYPHRCSICGKGFAVKGDLRGHEATHTNEKEFPCLCCDRVFAYKKNLQMHMRKKHQMVKKNDEPWVAQGNQIAQSPLSAKPEPLPVSVAEPLQVPAAEPLSVPVAEPL